ncbi:MAG: low molecular weight phosphatase family protein [Candidatus Bathyarchaeota archaeon]|nr:low molecular weight phosphatase family protein [Candidatus Bathyarchaeota archaeon]MDH5780855.1 low molecular weight phosphatase family protein [Candidatus Bathyarchaeota archaeon]
MKILFVCTGNSFRSPVAEALLKTLRGDLEADSAGTHPASTIAPNAKRLLEKMNAAKNLKTPEGVNQKNLEEYDLIVAMKEEHNNHIINKHPHLKEKIIIWNIDDPYFLPTGSDRRILKEIEENVRELSASL